MKFLTVIVLALSLELKAQDKELLQDAITKPAFSSRCKELFQERAEKIKVQQKLNALLQRNQNLVRDTPKAKEINHTRLKVNQLRIKNELYLANMKIETMEEYIVRSGCPGLTLE